MIVDIPIQTAATVRKVRARSSIETAHTVVRPVSIPSATDEEAPVFARSGTDDDPFGDVFAWRMHGGRHFVEVGRAAEAARIVGTRVFNHTDAILKTAAGGDERTITKPGDVREVERTNETAVAALAQKIVDKRFLVVGTKLYEIATPPVVTVEHAAHKHGTPLARRITGLPACLWDLDAKALKKIFDDGKIGRFHAKPPEIVRRDLLTFDRDTTIARRLAEKTVAAIRKDKVLGPGHPAAILARLARSSADAATILSGTREAIDSRSGSDAVARSVESMSELLKLRRSEHLEPDADGRATLGLRPGGDASPMIVVRPRVLDSSEIRTVASLRYETKEPSFISMDETSFISEMSVDKQSRLNFSDKAPDAYWRTWAVDHLVSMMVETREIAIPAFPQRLKYDDDTIEDIQQFAWDNLLVIDGRLHLRVDEPYIHVDKDDVAVINPARGTGGESLDRSIRDAWKHTTEIQLPFGMQEASLALQAAEIMAPKAKGLSIDIIAPEVFSQKTSRRVAAAFAARLTSRIPAMLMDEEGAAADELMDLAIAAAAGEPAEGLEAAAGRMLDLIVDDGMLSPLSDSPERVMLNAWLVYHTSLQHTSEDEDIPSGFDLFA